jgi:thioredoxin-like negative regulator of GroEL
VGVPKPECIAVAKINAIENPKSAARFGVEGYPTIKLFKDGTEYMKYKGERDFASMHEWAKRHGPPSLLTVDSIEGLAELKARSVDVGMPLLLIALAPDADTFDAKVGADVVPKRQLSVWCLVSGVGWCMVYGVWCMVCS